VKRIAAAGAALVAAAAVSGCGAVPSTDVAATVGDQDLTVERLESILVGVSSQDGSGVEEDPATGTVDGDFARNVLSVFVRVAATNDFLTMHGESITDEDRQAVLDSIPEDDAGREQPDVLNLVVDLNAGQAALERVAAPGAEELQAAYEEAPGDLGVLCVRHVLVEDEATAVALVEELDGGASAEDLAVEHSTDPSAANNGGAIELTPGQGCVGVGEALQQGLDATFVDAALTTVPGTPSVVQTDFGWHVIVARPYDEVSESLATMFETGAGQLLLTPYLREVDVRIDPRYGRWDAASGSVVAL
jgi:hypothetical protein